MQFIYHKDLLILRDFNIEDNKTWLKFFCDTYSIKNATDQPTFSRIWKTFNSFMCPFDINKLLKIYPKTFNSDQNLCATETGLSDFRKMTATAMRMKFDKL